MKTSKLDKVSGDVIRLYWEEGKTVEEIAEIYGLDHSNVSRWLKEHGGTRPKGPIKTKVEEVLTEPHKFDTLDSNQGTLAKFNEGKSEIYEDMCEQVLEDLQNGRISKTEAQLKYLFLSDEFEELGQIDFDSKYRGRVNETGTN